MPRPYTIKITTTKTVQAAKITALTATLDTGETVSIGGDIVGDYYVIDGDAASVVAADIFEAEASPA
jgi:hypothetical protein